MAASSGESPAAATGKTHPITQEAKDLLKQHFTSANWPLNRNLPRGEGYLTGDLGKIVMQFGLNRGQVARQLRNFKDEKYGNTQIKILLDAEQLEEKLMMGLSMDPIEFVTLTLQRMVDEDDVAFSRDSRNLSSALGDFPPQMKTFVSVLSKSPEDACCGLLSGLVGGWVKLAAEQFPKTAAGLPNAEVDFQKDRRLQKDHFILQWREQHQHTGVTATLPRVDSRKTFVMLGKLLYNLLFFEWKHASLDDQRPPVSIPEGCLVGKFAERVVYYVAGWTIYSASKALTVAEKKRDKYFLFAQAHFLGGKEEAKALGLPCSLVERRKRRAARVYCSKEYYEFICFVETVYLGNLTLKMMRAYCDGDIVERIKAFLLADDTAVEKFRALCNNETCGGFTEGDMQQIMEYMMKRYANMRGTFFARHLRGNVSGNLVDNLRDSQATRTRVASTVATSKAVAEAAKEKQIWEDAAINAFEYADQEEQRTTD